MSPRISAAGYLRVSSEKQGRDNRVSIPEQKRLIEERARQDGAEIVQWYADYKKYRSAISNRLVEPSGTRADRPEFVAMLADMQAQKWAAVYAWAQDRLGRGATVTAQLRDAAEAAKCEIRLVIGAWDADTAELIGAVAGMEIRRIKHRMAMGRVGRYNKGLSCAAPAEGYEIIRDAEGTSIGYRLTEAARALLAEVARRIIAGESYYQVALAIGRGETWVRDAVRSQFYRGKVRLNGESRKGQHEPAWDDDTIRALDREIARRRAWSNSRPRRRPNGKLNLFSGLLRCGHCGGWMKTNNQSHAGHYWLAYTCHRRYRYDSRSHPPNNIMESSLVSQVRQMFEALTNDEIIALVSGKPDTPPAPDERLTRLRTQAADLERALQQVQDIPAAARAIETDLERVRGEIESALVEQIDTHAPIDTPAILVELDSLRSPDWWRGDREQIRAVLRSAIRELWVKGGLIVVPPDTV